MPGRGVVEDAVFERITMRAPADRAEAEWDALVQGRLALGRLPNGGWDVRPTAPHERAGRALTCREVAVVLGCVRGMPNKEIAHELGIAPSAVSAALSAGARKLGLSSGRELVQVASLFRPGSGDAARLPRLTAAEREVAELVRRGWTNAAIAEARGCSVCTVANQVASILRKTGLGSRRAVMVGIRCEGLAG